MRKRWHKLAALPIAFTLVAAACGSDDDDDGADDAPDTTEAPADDGDDDDGGDDGDGDDEEPADGSTELTVTGPERSEEEAGALQETLAAWGEENGIEVTYIGDADWEANINTQVEGGNPPDISIFPQPGKIADFARDGFIVEVTDQVVETMNEFWTEDWTQYGNVDGAQYAVPVKSDLKSLVWYKPAAFEAAGYEVPETFDEFTALIDEMAAADGPKPLCVGIESGQATGWPFTDWVEDMVLRQHGPDVYDQWVANEVPFDDPQIVESMQTVNDLWTEDNVYADGGSIAATSFQANATPLVDEQCYMHRQANFFASFMPEGTPFGDGPDAIDVFYFPDINGDRPVLGAGTLAAGFNDNSSTMALLEYMSTAEYAETRQAAQAEFLGGATSGFLSAAQGQDPSVYNELEQSFLEILETSEIFRFDGSDLMPADVGAGTFWSQGVALVNGDATAEEAAAEIQASWPS